MRYADHRCHICAVGGKYVVTGNDVFTGVAVRVVIPANELEAYRRGELIQDAMPSLSIQEREFLICGMWEDFK